LKEGYAYAQISAKFSGYQYHKLSGVTPGQELIVNKSKGRAMVLCLDKSGSMSGRPFEALKQGAVMLASSIFETSGFQHFETYLYDEKVLTIESPNLENYKQKVTALKAGGSTNFVAVFK